MSVSNHGLAPALTKAQRHLFPYRLNSMEMTCASAGFKQFTDFVRYTAAHRTDRSFFRLGAFPVIAAAKQIVPPSTAAGIEADIRRGTFREIDGPGSRRRSARGSFVPAARKTA